MKQLEELKKSHVICFCIIVMVLDEALKKFPIGILDYFESVTEVQIQDK